jgi:hypothetical protein
MVTITGGRVTAGSFADAAGIGGGRGGDGGTVTISGGTVTAASIGGGMFGAAGTILITGGTVTANAGARAAGMRLFRNYERSDNSLIDYPSNGFEDAKTSFETLWASINGAESWNENPWVWVIEFKRIEMENAQ